MTDLRVCHLYPEHLNIYADRGNIAVLRYRCEWRGIALRGRRAAARATPCRRPTSTTSAAARIATRSRSPRTWSARAADLRAAVDGGAAVLAVCGGYQLLGHGYRGHAGRRDAGHGARRPRHRGRPDADDRQHRDPLRARPRRPAHGGRVREPRRAAPASARASSRSAASCTATATTARDGGEGVRAGRVIGTYIHGPLLPKNPWLADWLVREALERRHGHRGARPARRRARARGPPGRRADRRRGLESTDRQLGEGRDLRCGRSAPAGARRRGSARCRGCRPPRRPRRRARGCRRPSRPGRRRPRATPAYARRSRRRASRCPGRPRSRPRRSRPRRARFRPASRAGGTTRRW